MCRLRGALNKLVFRHALTFGPITGFNPNKNGLDVVSKQTKVADTFLGVENVEALPGFDGSNRAVPESAQEPDALNCAGIAYEVVVGLGRHGVGLAAAVGAANHRRGEEGRA